MKAIVLQKENSYPEFVSEHPQPMTQKGEVLVKLAYAALNRRDYWISQGMYPQIKVPVILGSDGSGTVGDRKVIVYPALHWGDNKRVQSNDYAPLGMPKDGTLAQFLAIDEKCLFDQPEYLTDAEAGCIGMAGLTAYRALFTRGECRPRERVLINGVGGGVALMAFQLAIANSAEVYVTSGSDEKIAQAMKLGAKGGFNYKKDDWYKSALADKLQFDVIIDSAGGPGFSNLIKIAAPGGRIVTYGGTHGAITKLNTQIIFWRQLSILGTTMGSPTEFKHMLSFMTKHQIRPIIDRLYYWHEVDTAFDAMRDSSQFGKLVFSLQ